MFRTCRSLQTGLILLALGACSKEPAPLPTTPLAPAITAKAAPTNARTVSSRVTAAGIAATYDATFEDGERLRIAEQRTDSRNGEYEFRGARLLHYYGAGLSSAAPIELSFDLQGALQLAKSESGTLPPEEVSAIRARAQLLRSHALAQKSNQNHY
jgi:hypothetical protein